MRVQPRKGANVWDPDHHCWLSDKEPSEVPESTYYRRRIMDGDLLELPEAEAAEEPKQKPAKGK
jgi:hypothetical protein